MLQLMTSPPRHVWSPHSAVWRPVIAPAIRHTYDYQMQLLDLWRSSVLPSWCSPMLSSAKLLDAGRYDCEQKCRHLAIRGTGGHGRLMACYTYAYGKRIKLTRLPGTSGSSTTSDDEEVLYVFRKHPVVMRKGLVFGMAAWLVGPLYVLILTYTQPNNPPTLTPFGLALGQYRAGHVDFFLAVVYQRVFQRVYRDRPAVYPDYSEGDVQPQRSRGGGSVRSRWSITKWPVCRKPC